MNALKAWESFENVHSENPQLLVDQAKFIIGYNAALAGKQDAYSKDELVLAGWACGVIDLEKSKDDKEYEENNTDGINWEAQPQKMQDIKNIELAERVRTESLSFMQGTINVAREEMIRLVKQMNKNKDNKDVLIPLNNQFNDLYRAVPCYLKNYIDNSLSMYYESNH